MLFRSVRLKKGGGKVKIFECAYSDRDRSGGIKVHQGKTGIKGRYFGFPYENMPGVIFGEPIDSGVLEEAR